MKTAIRWLLLFVLLLSFGLLVSCGSKVTVVTAQPEGEQAKLLDGGETYTVTFVVAGKSTPVEVQAGEIPVYPWVIVSWEDGEHYYAFSGWDKEIVPASANTTYTAQFGEYGLNTYTVFWRTQNGLISTTVHEGETPTPPMIPLVKKGKTTVYTFTGSWTPALSPATSDRTVYTAVYDLSERLFDVQYELNGEIVATRQVTYNQIPEAPDPASLLPEGKNYVYWQGAENGVTDDVVYHGIATNFNPETVALAKSAVLAGGANQRAFAAQYLALAETESAGIATEELIAYLQYAIRPGNDPTLDFSPNMYQPSEAGAIACCKQIPGVWGRLTSGEIEKLDYLMKGMACIAAIASDDSNSYSSGPGYTGNYGKSWNPNYPISNITMILFAVSYFGSADNVNQVLRDFDYDTYIAKFTEWGWTNTLSRWTRETTADTVYYMTASEGTLKEKWAATILTDDGNGHLTLQVTTSSEDVAAQTYAKASWGLVEGETRVINYTTPKAMLMEGGPVYCMTALYRVSQYVGKAAGTGLGIPAIGEKGYQYQGYTLDQVDMMWQYLQTYNYSGGVVSSREVLKNDEYLCYIVDGTSSPVEGLTGMMKEFRSGERSSVGYCSHDYNMGVAATAGLTALGLYDPYTEARATLHRMVWVGNTDFLYKAEHGYVSYTGTAVRGDPKPTYATSTSDLIWRSFWLDFGGKEFTLSDFTFPDLAREVPNSLSKTFAKEENGSNDLTLTFGKSSTAHVTDVEWWEKDFIQELSILVDSQAPTLGFRLRAPDGTRDNVFVFSSAGTMTPSATYFTPIGSSPASISLGEPGWHRIAIRFHQGAEADDENSAVTYAITFTFYLDGVEVGSYAADVEQFFTKGWHLFSATYDDAVDGHLIYTDHSGVYWQAYGSKLYNNSAKRWILCYGDASAYAGTAIRPSISPVVYELNGGSFDKTDVVETPLGYAESYTVSRVAYFAYVVKDVALETPTREGYTFAGWYTTPDFSGNPVNAIHTIGDPTHAPITYYAKWTAN